MAYFFSIAYATESSCIVQLRIAEKLNRFLLIVHLFLRGFHWFCVKICFAGYNLVRVQLQASQWQGAYKSFLSLVSLCKTNLDWPLQPSFATLVHATSSMEQMGCVAWNVFQRQIKAHQSQQLKPVLSLTACVSDWGSQRGQRGNWQNFEDFCNMAKNTWSVSVITSGLHYLIGSFEMTINPSDLIFKA